MSTRIIILLSALATSAHAQDFEIPWHTVDCGGGASVGGSFALTGTIGQHDAGSAMIGGSFRLVGGFDAAVESPACPADLDDDGDTDADDFFAYLDAFASGDQNICDLDEDGFCDGNDFFAYLDLFAQGC